MKRTPRSGASTAREPRESHEFGRLREVMRLAEKAGLLRGERTKVVRGRMPEALVTRAKKRTGINSDTELIEVALANIAVQDDYADWLISRRGMVDSEVDLEF